MSEEILQPGILKKRRKLKIAKRLAKFTIGFLFIHIIFLTGLTLYRILYDKETLDSYIHFSAVYMPVIVLVLSVGSLLIRNTSAGRLLIILALIHAAIMGWVFFM